MNRLAFELLYSGLTYLVRVQNSKPHAGRYSGKTVEVVETRFDIFVVEALL